MRTDFLFTQNTGLAEVFLIALQLLHISDKMEQAPVAGLLKGNGPLDKHPHIGLPLGSRRLRRQVVAVACSLKELLDKFVDGEKFGALAVSMEIEVEIM